MNLTFEMLPPSWEFCFNEQCAMHEKCIRWQSAMVIPSERLTVTAVTPHAASMAPCPFYKEMRLESLAWGFNRLFHDVKARDCKAIRMRMTEYFGCRTAYYNYHYGKKKLNAKQQLDIISIFNNAGYNEGLSFDNYALEYEI